MKFIKLLLTIAIVLSITPCNAQLANNIESPTESTTTQSSREDTEEDNFTHGFKKASSGSINYMGQFKKAAGLNLDFRFSYFNIGGGMSVSGGDSWNIYAGAAHRYYFTKGLFIDGAIGPCFSHSSYEYRALVGQVKHTTLGKVWYSDKYETKKESNSAFGMYVLPRLGLLVCKGWGINIGYMMTAPKFKFDGFFKYGDVMLGLMYSN